MTDIAIRVEGLGKRYRLGQQVGYKTLRETLLIAYHTPTRIMGNAVRRRRQPQDSPQSSVPGPQSPVPSPSQPSGPPSSVSSPSNYIWALKDVSFEVKQGEAVGIIGRNGSGKSTLLKILSRITAPTEGQIEIRGRVGSLLEVGTGFHPELSGRENIYLNGAIIGMKRAEVRRKFDEIVAFAEIEKFLDTPVKRYSSGMYVRLAFAVAAHLEPDVLLVDEVLAVGDALFQKKCLGKMDDLSHGGRTVLFVSHNLGAISSLCAKSLLVSDGSILRFGATQEVIGDYGATSSMLAGECNLDTPKVARRGDATARFVRARLFDMNGRSIMTITEGEPFEIELGIIVHMSLPLSILSITLVDQQNNDLYTTMHYDSLDLDRLEPGSYSFRIAFKPNFLSRGSFNVRLACFGPNFHEYDHIQYAFSLEVSREHDDRDLVVRRPGTVNLPMPWRVSFDPHDSARQ